MSENRRKSDRLNIRIEPGLKAQFEQYLEETGRTMSWLVTKWIREELERYYKRSDSDDQSNFYRRTKPIR